MLIMGRSIIEMVGRYQHITHSIRHRWSGRSTRWSGRRPAHSTRQAWVRPLTVVEKGGPPYLHGTYRPFLFRLVNKLAEDKRFELLRVSPTRFPILLLTVQRQSGPCVTRHDRTERTVPAAAGRPRMRRRLRRRLRRRDRCSSSVARPRVPLHEVLGYHGQQRSSDRNGCGC